MTRDQLLRYYRSLTDAERIDLLVEQERVKAQLEADQQCLLSVIDVEPAADPVEPRAALDKHYVRDEVACALRLSFQTARCRLVHARDLVHRLPSTWELLAAGDIGYLHCRNLIEAVARLDDATADRVQARVLPRAAAQTPAEFRRAVKRAVAAFDPTGEEERHEAASETRRVARHDEPDGMASIYAFVPAPDADIIMTCLDAAAGRMTDARTMDQRRADVLTELSIDGLDRVCTTQHGRKPAVQVTVALSTLLGLDEQPGELTGYGAIPAGVARRMAADPTGTWTRLVTDATGRLLDLGTERYRPPQNLQDFVIARDRTCRMPGCNRNAGTCDLDHAIPWPAGPTDAANLHALCRRHHHLKHESGWHVERNADGATVWTTSTGHRYEKPPAAYPIDHTVPEVHRESSAA